MNSADLTREIKDTFKKNTRQLENLINQIDNGLLLVQTVPPTILCSFECTCNFPGNLFAVYQLDIY